MIGGILNRLFPVRSRATVAAAANASSYDRAMEASDDLLTKMREASGSTDVARAVMADLWHQRNNVPFMATMVEAVAEMKAPLEQRPTDQ